MGRRGLKEGVWECSPPQDQVLDVQNGFSEVLKRAGDTCPWEQVLVTDFSLCCPTLPPKFKALLCPLWKQRGVGG